VPLPTDLENEVLPPEKKFSTTDLGIDRIGEGNIIGLSSVHPETLPKLKLWIPRYQLFGVQSFSFGNIFGVSGWTLSSTTDPGIDRIGEGNIIGLSSVHPETLPKLKLWIPRYQLFGVQSFSFGNIFGVSGWTLSSTTDPGIDLIGEWNLSVSSGNQLQKWHRT